MSAGWMVAELKIREGDWAANRALAELDLPHEGILVLGIERTDRRYVGRPKGTAAIHPGDTVIVYGHERVIDDVDRRRKDTAGEESRRASRWEFDSESRKEKRGDGLAG